MMETENDNKEMRVPIFFILFFIYFLVYSFFLGPLTKPYMDIVIYNVDYTIIKNVTGDGLLVSAMIVTGIHLVIALVIIGIITQKITEKLTIKETKAGEV